MQPNCLIEVEIQNAEGWPSGYAMGHIESVGKVEANGAAVVMQDLRTMDATTDEALMAEPFLMIHLCSGHAHTCAIAAQGKDCLHVLRWRIRAFEDVGQQWLAAFFPEHPWYHSEGAHLQRPEWWRDLVRGVDFTRLHDLLELLRIGNRAAFEQNRWSMDMSGLQCR